MPAGGVRRILAVFIDVFAYSVVWASTNALAHGGSVPYGLAAVFVLDVALTSFGVSAGRWITGIRVAAVEGGRPGLRRSLIRTALAFATGWVGLGWVSLLLWWRREEGSDRPMPDRLWWDSAAGTQVVRRLKTAL